MRRILAIGVLLLGLLTGATIGTYKQQTYMKMLGGDPYLVTVDEVMGQIFSSNAKRIQKLSAGPTCDSTASGIIYYDTDDNLVYWCNGTSYVTPYVDANGSITLEELSDTTITSLASGDYLTYNGTAWVNTVPAITFRTDDDGTGSIVTGDKGKIVTFGHASANAVSIARAGTAGFEAGWYVTRVCTTGAGTTTITPTTSTINGAATLALTQNQCASIHSDGANYRAAIMSSGGGSDSGAILIAYCNSTVGTGNGTTYILVPGANASGNTCSGSTSATEQDVPYTCTAKNLRVRASAAGSAAGSGVVTLFVGGSGSALTCTLGTGTSCSDTSNTVALTAGTSLWSMRVTTGQASDTTANVRATFQCQP